MEKKLQKLELTWIGKDKRPRLEPRVLVEDVEKSHHAAMRRKDGKDIFDNMLIHGDNLLALKALEQQFTGKVKCIYIDPPYNTGSAFTHYDDGLEHSIWLGLMRERLELLHKLLSEDGCIAAQIDSRELAYLMVIMDEIFLRENRINIICVKTKIAGVSGSNLGKSLQDNAEYVLMYAKDMAKFKLEYIPIKKQELMAYIEEYMSEGKSWKYTSVIKSIDEGEYIKSFNAGNGDEIKLYKHKLFEIRSINQIAKEEFDGDIKAAYYQYINSVFRTTNAQTSIRTRVIEETKQFGNTGLFSIEYAPTKGKHEGLLTRFYYKDDNLIAWLRDVTQQDNDGVFKVDVMGNIWDNIQYNNLTKEGNVQFPNGKKPEALVSRIVSMATAPGDLVLDSFLGSGTTAAVAHKMGRRWIGVELGDHCYTHCKVRLDKVIDGEDPGGITKAVGWKGGGGYRFFELAPTLITKDKWGQEVINKEYNPTMLAEAVCKLEGYTYAPSETEYFIHGHSTEKSFIYVTTNFIRKAELDDISEQVGGKRSLLICCKGFDRGASCANVRLKKIPEAVLKKCEWGHDDYSLNVANLPMSQDVEYVQDDFFGEG